jgi:hypothetical protein
LVLAVRLVASINTELMAATLYLARLRQLAVVVVLMLKLLALDTMV